LGFRVLASPIPPLAPSARFVADPSAWATDAPSSLALSTLASIFDAMNVLIPTDLTQLINEDANKFLGDSFNSGLDRTFASKTSLDLLPSGRVIASGLTSFFPKDPPPSSRCLRPELVACLPARVALRKQEGGSVFENVKSFFVAPPQDERSEVQKGDDGVFSAVDVAEAARTDAVVRLAAQLDALAVAATRDEPREKLRVRLFKLGPTSRPRVDPVAGVDLRDEVYFKYLAYSRSF
jgi:hypothetical protein